MQAAVFKGVGSPLRIETRPDPVPGAGELVLRVGRCGVCGTDLSMTDGSGQTYEPDSITDPTSRHGKHSYSLKDFGLSAEGLREEFADYRAEFGFP